MSRSSSEEEHGDGRLVPLEEPFSPFFTASPSLRSHSMLVRSLVGIGMIALIIVAWVAEAEYLQLVTVGSSETGKAYAKPWFMVYLTVSSYTLALPVWAVWRFKFSSSPFISWQHEIPRPMLVRALLLSLLTTFGGYAWFASLPITTVSANTAIYNASAAFVFLFSLFLVKERVSLLKIASLVISIGGVVLIAYFGSGQNERTELSPIEEALIKIDAFLAGQSPPPPPGTITTTPAGFAWVVLSTICWALFSTLYGKYAADTTASEAPERNFLWLGLIGLGCLLLQWPLFVPLHFLGVEIFTLPSPLVFGSLLVVAVLDVLLTLANLVGIAFTSPLFIALGSVLSVPASVLVDKLAHGYTLPWPALLGALFVLAAFVMLNVDTYLFLRNQKRPERAPLIARGLSNRDNDTESVPLEDSESEENLGTMRIHGLSERSNASGTMKVNSNYEDVGTMRIVSADGKEAAIGTIRFFPGNDWGTFVYNHSVALDESTGDDIPLTKKSTPIWLKVAKKINLRRDEVEKLKPSPPSQSFDEPPAWLKTQLPEDWEVNILALEKGEWIPEMEKSKEAFKRFKRDRKAVRSSLYRPLAPDNAASEATEDRSRASEANDSLKKRSLQRKNRRRELGASTSASSIVEEEESEISLNAGSDDESSTLEQSGSVGSEEGSSFGSMKRLRKKEAKSLQKQLRNLQ